VVISSGRDFYSSPRQNPLSNEICWLEWDHPNMPWDGSELFVGDFESKPNIEKKLIDGSKNISIIQPDWSQSGELIYISDESGWWNLYKYIEGKKSNILNEELDHGGPSWQFGYSTYFIKDDFIYLRGKSKKSNKGLIRKINFSGEIIDEIKVNHTAISYISNINNNVIYIGSTPNSNSELVSLSLIEKNIKTLKESNPVTFDSEDISIAEEISFPTTYNEKAYAYFYKPQNKNYEGWKSSTKGIRNFESLPDKAKVYVTELEDFIGAKVSSISTSPERDDTILIENPFEV